jgi:hypothetical protein
MLIKCTKSLASSLFFFCALTRGAAQEEQFFCNALNNLNNPRWANSIRGNFDRLVNMASQELQRQAREIDVHFNPNRDDRQAYIHSRAMLAYRARIHRLLLAMGLEDPIINDVLAADEDFIDMYNN